MRSILLLIFVFIMSFSGLAQKSENVAEYINAYKQLAIEEMIRTGVPASITMAQGIHETEAGKSDLVLKSNNHFGIKCKAGWEGEKVYHDDDARGECFRSYSSPIDSYRDHSNFLRGSNRYAFLFQLDPTDYKGWANGLKKAGYATNNKYSQILIKLIEDYNLQQYSLIALGKISPGEEQLTGIKKPSPESRIPAGPLTLEAPIIEEAPGIIVSYPSGEFTINKTRVLFVKAGTSLLSLAQQYDISLSRLLDFNDLNQEEVLVQDQLIYLQRKRKFGSADFHIVQKGESLFSISQSEGIRLESLLRYNLLKPGSLPATGERLNLKNEAGAPPKLVTEEIIKGKPVSVTNHPTHGMGRDRKFIPGKHGVNATETLFGYAEGFISVIRKNERKSIGNYQCNEWAGINNA